MSDPIVAAADGSALRNPEGPAGWCWYVSGDCWAADGWVSGTNNVAELTAVLMLLRATAHTGRSLIVESDSMYTINCATKWIHGWEKNGWRTASRQPVKNADLIRLVAAELVGRDVSFQWIKGHSGHPRQEAADLGAHSMATAFDVGGERDHGPGWTLG